MKITSAQKTRPSVFTLILAVILVGLFTYIGLYFSLLEKQQQQLKSLLQSQADIIEVLLKTRENSATTNRKIALSSASKEQVNVLWEGLQQSHPNLTLWLIRLDSNEPISELQSQANASASINQQAFTEMALTMQQSAYNISMISKKPADYFFTFQGYQVIEPKKWGLILYDTSQSIHSIVFQTLIYTLAALFVVVLFIVLVLSRLARQGELASQIRYEDLIQHAHNWVWEVDLNGHILFSNPEAETMLGYSLVELQNQPIFKYFDHNANHNPQLVFKQNLMQKQAFNHLELAFRHKQGHTLFLLLSAYPIVIKKRVVFRGLAIDITQTKTRESKILNQAFYDPLTGLLNRQHFIDQLDKHIQRKKITKEPKTSALLFIDLDGFKKVNDSKGHDIGDELLKIVSKRLQSQLRQTDLLSRFGGDEFVMLIKSQNSDSNKTFNDKLQTCLKRTIEMINDEVIIDKMNLSVGASIGVALLPQDGNTVTEILNHADMAMYQAKSRGKNTYEFFNQYTKSLVDKKIKTTGELEAAIDNNELELYYQFQFENNRIYGIEALLRWHHPVTRKVISAKDFISDLDSQYHSHLIDEWVINQVTHDMQMLKQQTGQSFNVSINLSTHEMIESTLPNFIAEALEQHHLDPKQLSIEVSENILAESFTKASKTIKKLDQLGVNTVIDHFGTGKLSLSNLQRMPIKAIKIDQSFIEHIASRHSDLQMSRAIIQLAKALQMKIVAGCIETSVQKDILTQEGCDILQGYHFSKPVALNKLIEIIQHHEL